MNRHNTGGVPGANLITGLEHGLGHAPPIQECTVTAVQILDVAGLFSTFEGKMQAGDRLVERKRHVSFFAPPDTQELVVQ